ncbi:MAG: chromosome segregation protein SMC, partial [Phycisphaerales bacterium]|nr:chromosome segregation protein SMC [Phycisphaerales bacterium]
MFLKRIVAHGFKSFADRTDIEFAQGMTGIVGPNGCGKSNVLDAIRWVLGEQSARLLRGGRMLDVVFSGSRSRKPANFAEVTLVFGGCRGTLSEDHDEVSVGRVLYRSGDSEYKVNGQSVRLKDVRELFLDTGIGVDAYSVIAQGRVDAMLQANPQQRRELFEEAAGVSRYKLRRVEAQRKLERSQNNLLRINDIIEELERRLRSVKLAASKARKFQEYDGRLRELRAAFSLSEFHEHTRALARFRARAADLSDLIAAKRAELAARDSEGVALDTELLKRDEEIRAIEGDLAAVQAEISGLVERIVQIERREHELLEAQVESAQRARELVEASTELEARLATMSAELATLRDEESAGITAVTTAQKALQVAQQAADDARRSLQSGQATVFDATREVARLENRRSAAEQEVEQLESRLEQIQSRARALIEAASAAVADERRCDERVKELEARAEAAAQTLARVESDLAGVRGEIEAIEVRLGAAADKRSAARSRLELLLDMERRQEGVAQGARALLRWREATPDGGVVGIAADLLRVDGDYVAALRPLLTRIENRVVVREQAAFVDAMRHHGEPEAAVDVIAVDRCLPAQGADGWRGREGVIALATDAVRVDAGFESLLHHLLGNVVLVDSLSRAVEYGATDDGDWVFVSPSGAFVQSSGRISMGVSEGGGGLISRRLEIARLEQDMESLERSVEEATRARATLRDRVADLQVERDAVQSGVAQTQREIGAARAELRRASDERARHERDKATLTSDEESVSARLTHCRADVERLAAELKGASDTRAAVESQLGALEAGVSTSLEAVRTLGAAATAAEVAAGRIQERREARESALQELS